MALGRREENNRDCFILAISLPIFNQISLFLKVMGRMLVTSNALAYLGSGTSWQ